MRLLGLAMAVLLTVATSSPAATIVIQNLDPPNAGFNDTTPATPVGGNPGTTVGTQRMAVFEEAARLWGEQLSSTVTIVVEARFATLQCDVASATLGAGSPLQVFRDFPNAEFPQTWYHAALANKRAAEDLGPGSGDVAITINNRLNGDPTCLGGTQWYYGLDGDEGDDVELLPVVLHELAHGLGFSSLMDVETGELLEGTIDVYTRFLEREDVLPMFRKWSDQSDAQRAGSARTPRTSVWNGDAVRVRVPLDLEHPPVLELLAPASLAATVLDVGTAAFGPSVAAATVTGDVALLDPTPPGFTGCASVDPGVDGKIGLVYRGDCSFAQKVRNAQDAGALGVLLVNDDPNGGPVQMGGNDPTITIPVLSVSLATGNAIYAEIGNGVIASLTVDDSAYAGASPTSNRLYVYTPDPLAVGSAVSHWDVGARPNLLMEPPISGDVSDAVDMTLYAFEDQGWFNPRVTEAPAASATRLVGNTPNPFNPRTTISFALARDDVVSLKVHDAAGREVATLVDAWRRAGTHRVTWDGTDGAGRRVASGVYRAHLRVGGDEHTHPMVLLK